MAASISENEFIEGFLDLRDRKETHFVDLSGDQLVPLRAWPSAGAKSLVILFHGAVKRDVRQYPHFLGFRSGVYPLAHQVSIADPSLTLSEEISNGWFAGSSGTQLQSIIPRFLDRLIKFLTVDRIIFAGGSGGGFAALYYSWLFPGSTAVVTVPQTNINKYHAGRRDTYLNYSWPNGFEDLQDVNAPCLDLREKYSTGMRNTVVYVQSNMDHHHVRNHMVPFIAALPNESYERLLLKCSFWGKKGHAGSVPTLELAAWIRAALGAEDQTPESISQAYYLANSQDFTKASLDNHSDHRSSQSIQYDSSDEQWTAKITAELLR